MVFFLEMISMKPWMSNREIGIIRRQLLHFSARPVDVLEWGSGGSTIYFTDILEQNEIEYAWTSLEYSKTWYEKIKELTSHKPNVKIFLFDSGNDDLSQRYLNMDEYVNYPRLAGKKYDLIIVDGRKRRRCLLVALNLLKSGGVVFLHNANRSYYHCALGQYADSAFLGTRLWRGRAESVSKARLFFNHCRNSFYFSIIRGRKALARVYYKILKIGKILASRRRTP